VIAKWVTRDSTFSQINYGGWALDCGSNRVKMGRCGQGTDCGAFRLRSTRLKSNGGFSSVVR
jgi:hypothetical protein